MQANGKRRIRKSKKSFERRFPPLPTPHPSKSSCKTRLAGKFEAAPVVPTEYAPLSAPYVSLIPTLV